MIRLEMRLAGRVPSLLRLPAGGVNVALTRMGNRAQYFNGGAGPSGPCRGKIRRIAVLAAGASDGARRGEAQEVPGRLRDVPPDG